MTKVLVVAPEINHGGVAAVAIAIAQAVIERGITCDFVTHSAPSENRYKKLSSLGCRVLVVSRLSDTTPWRYVTEVRRALREWGPYDAIHIHTASFIWLSAVAGILERVPIRVGHAHGSKNTKDFFGSSTIYQVFAYFNRVSTTKRLSCADTSGAFTFGHSFEFLPNFVEEEQYAPRTRDAVAALRLRYSVRSGQKVLVFAGALEEEKNPLFLLPLMATLAQKAPGVQLLIAGDGSLRGELEREINQQGIGPHVRCLGHVNDLAALFQIADCMLVPSFSEGMSVAAIEAQISGCLVVASPGVPETNDLGLGSFLKCGSYQVQEWVDNINRGLGEHDPLPWPRRMQIMRTRGLSRDAVTERLMHVYEPHEN